ncbi:hypothetical protein SAICODRAFT_9692 [Saitoella complicata NRRL Y-17804]|nr:uncharacterized protein SAICODRAFT_9692 [Saitoella complicata NRRL Y-17804]ODQ50729.1 hypothetical protein SAICODRAFT_9692 [Saitoella complicata NRRL Y-17804]
MSYLPVPSQVNKTPGPSIMPRGTKNKTAPAAAAPAKATEKRVREPVEEPPATGDSTTSSQTRKRKAVDEDAFQLPTLKSRSRKIRITSAWHPLPASAIETLMSTLETTALPIFSTAKSDSRRRETQAVLQHAFRKIENALRKLPVPPGSGEGIEYEKVLDQSRTLETGLVTDLEQVGVLERELERERRELEEEVEQLRELETNAKAAAGERRKRQKKLHPLLQTTTEPSPDDDIAFPDRVNLKRTSSSTYDTANDKTLCSLTTQLEQHLTSIQNNVAKVEGVVGVASKAEGALMRLMDRIGVCEDIALGGLI